MSCGGPGRAGPGSWRGCWWGSSGAPRDGGTGRGGEGGRGRGAHGGRHGDRRRRGGCGRRLASGHCCGPPVRASTAPISPRWLKACGKLPAMRPARPSYSSAISCRSLAQSRVRCIISTASSSRPMPTYCSTVARIEQELLTDDGLVLRYLTQGQDGLPGDEHPFLVCCFWLVEQYVGMGREDDAVEMMQRTLDCANDLQLMAEEYDGRSAERRGGEA